MLNGKLVLFDIRNVEAFCEEAITKSGVHEFGYLDHDDLLSELVEFCWEISGGYDPAKASFSTYATHRTRRFIVDWKRGQFRTRWVFRDHTYERPRPSFVPYDSELAGTLELQSLDRQVDRSPDLMRALGAGSGKPARGDDPLGEAPTRAAA
jgi:hypothetical protein